MADFTLQIKGRGGASYDRYPLTWPGGAAAPNLESFGSELLEQSLLGESDCLVFGSRGGQVVLPSLWAQHGASIPPAVVINGGCAMGLPTQVQWPAEAVTFLLIGGQDYFRGKMSVDEYLADVKSRVPEANSTTAILYVNEMPHMPQASLLSAVLPHMLRALSAWKQAGCLGAPQHDQLQAVLRPLAQDAKWSGLLTYTTGPGTWKALPFGGFKVAPKQQLSLRIAAVGGA